MEKARGKKFVDAVFAQLISGESRENYWKNKIKDQWIQK